MYTKLFNSIITSTVWLEPDATRIVWITLLAMADRHGEVMASVPGLARVAGVNVESCRSAIATLMAPDPDSRTKDEEGRRLTAIDGGWWIINYHKYRDMAASADRAEKAAVRQRRKRDRDMRNVTHSHATVTPESRLFCQAEAEAEADLTSPGGDGSVLNRKKAGVPSRGEVENYVREHAPEICAQEFYDFYESKNWMVGKNKMKQWKSAVATWRHRAAKSQKKPRLPDYNTPEGMAELQSAFLAGDAP